MSHGVVKDQWVRRVVVVRRARLRGSIQAGSGTPRLEQNQDQWSPTVAVETRDDQKNNNNPNETCGV